MTYTPLTKPRLHQAKALTLVKNRPKAPSSQDVFAWLMEYGTGKSKVICDEFGEREKAKDIQDLLVVAGAGSYLNWCQDKSEEQPSEFHRHLSEDLQDRMITAAWVSGQDSRAYKDSLERLLKTDRPRALVVNIEALSTSIKARELCRAFLQNRRGRRAMMAGDESTLFKSPTAERTEQVIQLGGDAVVRRLLTGLVAPNSPMDLYSQFMFLDWRILGHQSYYSFQARYAVLKKIQVDIPGKRNKDGTQKKRSVNIEVAYRNVEELQEKIAPYSYRVLKDDCLDLPPKIYVPIINVELTKEQKKHYQELHDYATTELASQDYVTATMVLTRNLRLQQMLCGYVIDENGVEHAIPSNRGKMLMEVLGEHSGKAIIWCPFHPPLQRIVQALQKEYGPKSVAQFHGKNKESRGEEERRWLGDPECRWMVSTQQAGGKGNTWVVASLVVYFANTENLEDRLNSEDRAHRDGLKHSVAYVDFNAIGTNEHKTVQSLRSKINIASVISGDKYKEWII